MGQPEYQQRLSIEEYLALEKETDTKYEYHDGEVYAMAGGTPTHSLIANNAGRSLGNALLGKRCFAYNSDLRVATSRNKYVYPDVSVVCGRVSFFEELKNAANNPVLIVEVLSEETRAYDRGGKFMRYRMMESFREYVLIDQSLPFVEVFYKNELNTWEYRAYTDLEGMIPLHSLDIEIPMADIYMGVDFLPFDPENLQLL
ncbi:Uma2 family endonuclease [Runella salmonicolor]|uniref:Uma2 family endonuclease n=1 Tax=Runella salmonicolor TaxID=2950278 RepID=A0ABT1FJS5_9BACT|nr:Uma2 family endonuclease [Runella salmonicolor]MCP1382028.1 Uma2 family endonuclease [Runella salmonicolor]